MGRVRAHPHALALVAVLLGAVALRAWHLDAGLPFQLVNPDEGTVVPLAFDVGRGSLNPEWFLYPSGVLYMLAGVWHAIGLPFDSLAFATDASSYLLSGRIVMALLGVALVWLAYHLGGRGWTGVTAAALVAVEGVSVAYSRVAVTDMPSAALATLGLVVALGAVRTRSPGRLVWAAVAVGAATSMKYSAGTFVIPLLVAALAIGVRDLRRLAILGGAALAAFVIVTPFSVLDPATFASSFERQLSINSAGWLGFESVGNGWLYNATDNLGRTLGPLALGLAAAGVVLAALRRTRRDLVLLAAAVPYFVYIGTWDAHFDRYLLPIVPVLAVLAAEALAVLAAAGRGPRIAAVALAAVAIAIPAVRSVDEVAVADRPDNRVIALERFEREVSAGTAVAVDPRSAPLADVPRGVAGVIDGDDNPWYRLVRLSTPNPNPAEDDPWPSVRSLQARGVQWVLTSASIRDRVRAAGERYPDRLRFYRQLDELGTEAWRVEGAAGPRVVAHRLVGGD